MDVAAGPEHGTGQDQRRQKASLSPQNQGDDVCRGGREKNEERQEKTDCGEPCLPSTPIGQCTHNAVKSDEIYTSRNECDALCNEGIN